MSDPTLAEDMAEVMQSLLALSQDMDNELKIWRARGELVKMRHRKVSDKGYGDYCEHCHNPFISNTIVGNAQQQGKWPCATMRDMGVLS